jgi:hypothetical protein
VAAPSGGHPRGFNYLEEPVPEEPVPQRSREREKEIKKLLITVDTAAFLFIRHSIVQNSDSSIR